MNSPMDTRKHNEKEYHNKVFAEGTRSVVNKYYAVARSSTHFYRQYLETHCPNKTALEYGCGPESYAFVMARKGTKVMGIDISETAIDQVKELDDRISDARSVATGVFSACSDDLANWIKNLQYNSGTSNADVADTIAHAREQRLDLIVRYILIWRKATIGQTPPSQKP